MAEREVNIFHNYSPGSNMRDYDDKSQVIQQGEPSPEVLERIKKAEKGELKAKLAAVMDRGIVSDRLNVDLPPDIHGEWVRRDPLEIKRLEALGFKIDDKFATNRGIHSDGSNSAIIGDVIFMICPKEVKEIIDEIRTEAVIKQHTKKRIKNKEINKEEAELYNNVFRENDSRVTVFSDSKEKVVTPEDISSILDSLNEQTQ